MFVKSAAEATVDNRQWHPLVRNGKNVKIKYEKNSERLRNLAARCFYLKYTIKANPSPNGNGFAFNLFGDLIGNRTRVYAVRGRRLNRLTIRPGLNCLCSISYFSFQGNCFYPSKRNFFLFFGKNIFLSPKRFFR